MLAGALLCASTMLASIQDQLKEKKQRAYQLSEKILVLSRQAIEMDKNFIEYLVLLESMIKQNILEKGASQISDDAVFDLAMKKNSDFLKALQTITQENGLLTNDKFYEELGNKTIFLKFFQIKYALDTERLKEMLDELELIMKEIEELGEHLIKINQ